MRLLPKIACSLTLALPALIAPRAAWSWDADGHMLVAQVAYGRLTPDVRARADTLLQGLQNPAKPEVSYSFVTAACWMDDVRSAEKLDDRFKLLKPWHYVDRECDGKDPDPPHALWAIEQAETALRGYKDAPLAPDFTAPKLSQAETLAILLHLVGDVHQPLHAAKRDLGGNLYPISGVPDLSLGLSADLKPIPFGQKEGGVYERLHAMWDEAYRFEADPKQGAKPAIRLLYDLGNSTEPDSAKTQQIAGFLVKKFAPPATLNLRINDASSWVKESNQAACDWVFSTPAKAQPSNAYVHRAHDFTCRRVTLAGYRLAAVLNEILAAPTISPTAFIAPQTLAQLQDCGCGRSSER